MAVGQLASAAAAPTEQSASLFGGLSLSSSQPSPPDSAADELFAGMSMPPPAPEDELFTGMRMPPTAAATSVDSQPTELPTSASFVSLASSLDSATPTQRAVGHPNPASRGNVSDAETARIKELAAAEAAPAMASASAAQEEYDRAQRDATESTQFLEAALALVESARAALGASMAAEAEAQAEFQRAEAALGAARSARERAEAELKARAADTNDASTASTSAHAALEALSTSAAQRRAEAETILAAAEARLRDEAAREKRRERAEELRRQAEILQKEADEMTGGCRGTIGDGIGISSGAAAAVAPLSSAPPLGGAPPLSSAPQLGTTLAEPAIPTLVTAGARDDEGLEELLSRLSLSKVLQTFTSQDVHTVDDLRQLTESDFRDLGISIGVRRKIIGALGAQPPPPEPRPSRSTPAGATLTHQANAFKGTEPVDAHFGLKPPPPPVVAPMEAPPPNPGSAFSFIATPEPQSLSMADEGAEGTPSNINELGMLAGMQMVGTVGSEIGVPSTGMQTVEAESGMPAVVGTRTSDAPVPLDASLFGGI